MQVMPLPKVGVFVHRTDLPLLITVEAGAPTQWEELASEARRLSIAATRFGVLFGDDEKSLTMADASSIDEASAIVTSATGTPSAKTLLGLLLLPPLAPHDPAGTPESEFLRSIEIMSLLRSPGGCPWDREQDHHTLKRHLVEEAYEVLDAIEQEDAAELMEELGDLYLQVIFHAQIATEAGDFTMAEVMQTLSEKLIRRHPHIFGEAEAKTAQDVINRWERIKLAEKDKKRSDKENAGAPERTSALDGVARTLPALMFAQKISERAARTGFDWPDPASVREKVDEELAELQEMGEAAAPVTDRVAEELGDVLFSIVNLARHYGIEAEEALRHATGKFIRRFSRMEALLPDNVSLPLDIADWERLWEQVKRSEQEQSQAEEGDR